MVTTSCEVRHRLKSKKKGEQNASQGHSTLSKPLQRPKSYSSVTSLMLLTVIACVAWVFLHSGELSRRLNSAMSKSSSKPATDNESGSHQLPRLDPVKIGYTRVGIFAGIGLEVKTLSINPPIFEIPHFLSIQDISQLRELAYRSGMVDSQVINEEDTYLSHLKTDEEAFLFFDENNDTKIDAEEVRNRLIETSSLYFKEEDILKMFHKIGADSNNNGVLNFTEYLNMTTHRMLQYLYKLSKVHPRTLSRYSRQAWVDHNEVKGLAERIASVTGISLSMIKSSEDIQVVKYLPGGHYHCHFDSMDILEYENLPCCEVRIPKPCRLCRYMTILYFLNTVEKGGETAFLVADNNTFSDQVWSKSSHRRCDLSLNCHKANVVVQPEKGKAILWYNHFRNGKELGPLDKRSLHGGCDVLKGEKWIANNWINTL